MSHQVVLLIEIEWCTQEYFSEDINLMKSCKYHCGYSLHLGSDIINKYKRYYMFELSFFTFEKLRHLIEKKLNAP